MISDRLNHFLKAMTALIGLTMLGLFAIYFVQEATKVSSWGHSGTIRETRFRVTEDSVIVFRRVTDLDFLVHPIPQVGDTLLTIFGRPATAAAVDSLVDSPQPVGKDVPITYRGDGVDYASSLITKHPRGDQYALIVLLQWLRFLVGLGFLGVGLWAFFAQPDSAAVRVFVLFCQSMTAFIISGITVFGDGFAAFQIPYWDVIRSLLQIGPLVFCGFWINLMMLFPRPNKLMERHPAAAYFISYLIPIYLGILALLPEAMVSAVMNSIGNFLLLGALIAGFVMLTYRYVRARDKMERRQSRLVLWGSGLGLGAIVLLVIVAQAFTEWFSAEALRQILLINIAFVFLLLTPLSFAYAFNRYRLLEVQGKLRRGTRFVIVTGALLVVFFLIAYAIGELLIRNLGITSRTPTLAIALVLALGILPAQRRVRSVLEKRFYPERLRLRELLAEFLESSEYLVDQSTFWAELERRIRAAINVAAVYPVLAGADGKDFRPVARGTTSFERVSEFVTRLTAERRALLVDEMLASERIRLTEAENDWLVRNRIALIVPLITHKQLVGFLGIGYKDEAEDFTAEELNILLSFAPQFALASENIRLLEENLEKRRLEEQMAIARKIQEGFLPQVLPEYPGLEIAASSRFSLEVAGDYYDVIQLHNGEIVFAVGDVSGKGAGAALIMANLQASLRTVLGMGVELEKCVARINDLIHSNTSPEQFITFFVAKYDPISSTLSYVNAGHNPPLIIDHAGSSRDLKVGGLILGVIPGIKYEKETVALASGDVLLMYTDGLSEAMNDGGEEYGEERIREFVVRHQDLAPAELLDKLERDVMEFCGRTAKDDDCTMLIVKKT